MKLIIKRKILVGLILFLLTSCRTDLPSTQVLTTPNTNIGKTETTLPTIKPTTTQSSQPTVEPDAISPLEEIVFGNCLEVQPELTPVTNLVPWNLILTNGTDDIILKVNTGEEVNLSYFDQLGADALSSRISEIYVSPDGKWIAYEGTNNKLILNSISTIFDPTGKKNIIRQFDHGFHIWRWVGKDTLLIRYRDPSEPYYFLSLFYNPSTEEDHVFSIRDLPNYLEEKIGGAMINTNYWVYGDLVPDPTMTRIIYPSRDQTDSYIYNILWSVEEEKTLSRFRYFIRIENEPFWAADGSDFVMLTMLEKEQDNWYDEWFVMDRNGNFRQLTNFIDFFDNNQYYFEGMSRSPNGQYFVFQLSFEKEDEEIIKYVVLDIKSQEIAGFCIDSVPGDNYIYPIPWSPDSQFIVLQNTQNYAKGDLLVVDVKEQEVYKVANDMYPYGWIERNP